MHQCINEVRAGTRTHAAEEGNSGDTFSHIINMLLFWWSRRASLNALLFMALPTMLCRALLLVWISSNSVGRVCVCVFVCMSAAGGECQQWWEAQLCSNYCVFAQVIDSTVFLCRCSAPFKATALASATDRQTRKQASKRHFQMHFPFAQTFRFIWFHHRHYYCCCCCLCIIWKLNFTVNEWMILSIAANRRRHLCACLGPVIYWRKR